jgi:hypothetical protein
LDHLTLAGGSEIARACTHVRHCASYGRRGTPASRTRLDASLRHRYVSSNRRLFNNRTTSGFVLWGIVKKLGAKAQAPNWANRHWVDKVQIWDLGECTFQATTFNIPMTVGVRKVGGRTSLDENERMGDNSIVTADMGCRAAEDKLWSGAVQLTDNC